MYVNLIWRVRISGFFLRGSQMMNKKYSEKFSYLKWKSKLQLHYLIDIYIYIYIHYLQLYT